MSTDNYNDNDNENENDEDDRWADMINKTLFSNLGNDKTWTLVGKSGWYNVYIIYGIK